MIRMKVRYLTSSRNVRIFERKFSTIEEGAKFLAKVAQTPNMMVTDETGLTRKERYIMWDKYQSLC